MVLSGCATTNTATPDFIVNTIIPKAQPEDKSVAYPVCENQKTGDLFDCEKLWRQSFCLLVKKYDVFMRRSTQDKHTVTTPPVCLVHQEAMN